MGRRVDCLCTSCMAAVLRDYCAPVERAVGLGSALCPVGRGFSLAAVDDSESVLCALPVDLLRSWWKGFDTMEDWGICCSRWRRVRNTYSMTTSRIVEHEVALWHVWLAEMIL